MEPLAIPYYEIIGKTQESEYSLLDVERERKTQENGRYLP